MMRAAGSAPNTAAVLAQRPYQRGSSWLRALYHHALCYSNYSITTPWPASSCGSHDLAKCFALHGIVALGIRKMQVNLPDHLLTKGI